MVRTKKGKSNSKFLWWWQDKEELAVWHLLNSLTPEQRQAPKYREICEKMRRRYGNIYFFRPYPAQLPVHQDCSDVIFIHGNNSSGKSYCAAAYTAYEIIGWSPYREVKKAKYAQKRIWAFSPTFDIQRSSSQVHLFSTDAPNDIGLLPPLDLIEELGGRVSWHRRGILDYVEFPDKQTILEFKSADQASLSVAASGVDFVWLDECPPEPIYNETWARVIRKEGRMIMSFLIDSTEENYVVQDLYQKYLYEIREFGQSNKSFYFFTIEDNLSLPKEKIKALKDQFSTEQVVWRFSEGGRFITEVKGMKVYSNFKYDIHVKDDLISTFDPKFTLYRFWDLGKVKSCCIAVQVDRFGRLKYLFTVLGEERQLTDFIDDVEQHTYNLLNEVYNKLDVLPHDARRHYDVSPLSAEDIFHAKRPKLNTEVVYVQSEAAIALANDKLRLLRDGEPFIQIDSKHNALLIQCLEMHVRDSKTGEPKKHHTYAHISDAFKMSIQYLCRLTSIQEYAIVKEEQPVFYGLGKEHGDYPRKRHIRLFPVRLD